MPKFEGLHIGLGGPELAGQHPAPLLRDPGLSASLCQRLRKQLLDFPLHFLFAIELEGFPLIRLQWVSLCKTAGILLLRSGKIDPDVFGLLLNGVESEDEMRLIHQHAPPLRPHWQRILDAPRPLAVFGYYQLSRLKDPALATVLGAFANSYFAQFGTSGE